MAPPRQTLFAAVFQPLEGFTCFGLVFEQEDEYLLRSRGFLRHVSFL